MWSFLKAESIHFFLMSEAFNIYFHKSIMWLRNCLLLNFLKNWEDDFELLNKLWGHLELGIGPYKSKMLYLAYGLSAFLPRFQFAEF